ATRQSRLVLPSRSCSRAWRPTLAAERPPTARTTATIRREGRRAGLALMDCMYRQPGDNRWIVLTSIFKPTDCIRYMAEQIPGWNMVQPWLCRRRICSLVSQVVVGDKKTPVPWTSDWNIPAHVHYLSVEDQLKLPFKIIQHLPWANYGRKNIGFLYAI